MALILGAVTRLGISGYSQIPYGNTDGKIIKPRGGGGNTGGAGRAYGIQYEELNLDESDIFDIMQLLVMSDIIE